MNLKNISLSHRNLWVAALLCKGFIFALFSQSHDDGFTMGAYPVGFRSDITYDPSRPAVKEQTDQHKGRVLQVNIWYPAAESGTKALNFNDYVGLIAQEINPSVMDQAGALAAYYDWTFSGSGPGSEMQHFKRNGMEMRASMGSAFREGSFPAVLLMHGGAADFAFLGEYLASHGFIGINVPYKGYRQAELDVDVTGMQTQVADYEYALRELSRNLSMAPENISVIGVSFGGQSALTYSFSNPVKAIISYDGGIGSQFGAALIRSLSQYPPEGSGPPLLHLYNPTDLYTDLRFLRTYSNSDRTLVGMKNMEHAHFWSWGALDRNIPGVINGVRPGNSYDALFEETLAFLNTHARGKELSCDWCGAYESGREVISRQ